MVSVIVKTIALSLLLCVVSCATVTSPTGREAANITADMLASGIPAAFVPVKDDSVERDILELNSEMIEFLDRHVDMNLGDYSRLRQLLHLIIDDGNFNLVYDDKTRTAAETFRDRRGNCLSFTNMFIAMARYLELNAEFQEVEIPPDWSMDGQSFVLSRHINVYLEAAPGIHQVVDFNIDDFKSSYDMERVSDQRAGAHYYNNMGVEQMLAGNNNEALGYFAHAIESDPGFAPVWINLGILYRRAGFPVYAEASYLQAIRIDSKNMVAMSNLANLYERQGDYSLAEGYRKRVDRHRMRNPYYRYKLAREAYDAAHYEDAIDHMKVAVRQQKNVDGFYFLLGLSYFKMGDEVAGQRWLGKAMETVEKGSLKRAYHHKLELLLSSTDGGASH